MALDKQVFKTRTISAVIFGAVMLTALLGPSVIFYIVFGIATYIGAKEFLHIVERIENKMFNPLIAILFPIFSVSTFLLFAFLNTNVQLFSLNNSLVMLGISVLLFIVLTMHKSKLSALPLGFLYISLAFGLLSQLYFANKFIPLALIILIWINDTMQYVMGSLFGKHKMAPNISPKKTWEGTIYGSLCSIIVALILQRFFPIFNIYIALCATIVGTLGDLLESYLKRKAGVKDSGNIMPGHGGVLDRFDSLLLASVVYWVVYSLVQNF